MLLTALLISILFFKVHKRRFDTIPLNVSVKKEKLKVKVEFYSFHFERYFIESLTTTKGNNLLYIGF